MVITRFAPSPTGFLHIGGVRTAIFNWLYARHFGGKFLLRIEDTDKERSTSQALEAIMYGMKWMGLDWDGQVIYQSQRQQRHCEIVEELLKMGHAYYCYCSPAELDEMRQTALAEGKAPKYNGMWRDRDPALAPKDVKPVVRFKAPQTGVNVINDGVQSQVQVESSQLDDMVLLRSDGTPTYMLSVVVDDHDMDISHVIRGDDHLTNAFRQKQLYDALGWNTPEFYHVPLIHGPDGAKFSKRHGALGVEAYRDLGVLPEAMFNYLLRLGWSHGNDEIISETQAIEWFDGTHIGRSSARFDMQKLESLNAHYLRSTDPQNLAQIIISKSPHTIDEQKKQWLIAGMTGLVKRAKNINELNDNSQIYLVDLPQEFEEKAKLGESDIPILQQVLELLEDDKCWNGTQITEVEASLEQSLRDLSAKLELGLGKIAKPVRSALTGKSVSPSIFEIMAVIGKENTCKRLQNAL